MPDTQKLSLYCSQTFDQIAINNSYQTLLSLFLSLCKRVTILSLSLSLSLSLKLKARLVLNSLPLWHNLYPFYIILLFSKPRLNEKEKSYI